VAGKADFQKKPAVSEAERIFKKEGDKKILIFQT
jgi:hypothetical protein